MRLSVLAGMLDLRPRGLKALASVDDFERAAKRKLPRIVSDFVSGGSDSEITVQKNSRKPTTRPLLTGIYFFSMALVLMNLTWFITELSTWQLVSKPM